ncbi:hypothetical protein L1887_36776 [Cichorium endivia]|nr:hypothetical protein L1887_36776 [Cichorium endivia]
MTEAKPAQARGKKSGQEDDAAQKEDDTSTSEQHLEDTKQQSDVQSHEHIVWDISRTKRRAGSIRNGGTMGGAKGRGVEGDNITTITTTGGPCGCTIFG